MNKRIIIFIISLFIIGLLAYIVSTYFVGVGFINGDSMLPTYNNGNIVLIKKRNYKIEKDDIVVVKKNNLIIIKRIVGVPHDTLIVKEGKLYINNEVNAKYNNIQDEGILKDEVVLNKNQYFIIGDNYNNSIDSRSNEIGIIEKNNIIGKIIN